jgi:hypothetical protein
MQTLQNLMNTGENFEFGQAGGRIGLAVAHDGAIDDAIPIQKDGSPL